MGVFYNDIEPFCCDVLRARIADGSLPIGEVSGQDVKTLTGEQLIGYRQIHLFAGIGGFPLGLKWAGVPEDLSILTAGFPCQPFSVAGSRRGSEDDRNLWPETIRLIKECRPRWFIGENTSGIFHLYLDTVLADLEGAGYEAWATDLPACGAGAPHIRQRIWIVAHADDDRFYRAGSNGRDIQDGQRDTEATVRREAEQFRPVAAGGQTTADTASTRRQARKQVRAPGKRPDTLTTHGKVVSLSIEQRLEGEVIPQVAGEARRGSDSHLAGSDRPYLRHAPIERLADWSGGEVGQPAPLTEFERPGGREVEYSIRNLHNGLPNELAGIGLSADKHGIMGLLLLLRELYYVEKSQVRADQILRLLWKSDGEETIQWAAGRFNRLQKTEILQCPVHGTWANQGSCNYINVSQASAGILWRGVRELHGNGVSACASYRWRYNKQCTCELDDALRILSSEMALGEWENNTQRSKTNLLSLWQTCKSKGFLPEPLSAFREVWRSLFDEEIRSFQWSRDIGRWQSVSVKEVSRRVDRLKALGNAVVPQVVAQIGWAIMRVENGTDA